MRFLLFFLLVSTSLVSQDLFRKSISSKADSTQTQLSELKSFNNDLIIPITDEEEVNLEKYLDPEGAPTDGPNQFFIDFVGSANLQQNVSEANQDVQAAAGLGVIFERYFLLSKEKDKELENNTETKIKRNKKSFFESLDMEAYINVASNIDELSAIQEDGSINLRPFGSYLLNPITSKQSIFINTNVYFNPEYHNETWQEIFKWVSGFNIAVNGSNTLWRLDESTTKDAGALSLKGRFFHEFLPNDKIRVDNRRKYSVFLGFGYGYRLLVGDISSESNDSLRQSFLGTTDDNFSGLEFYFGFRLNNIIAEFNISSVGGANRDDIDGLTDTQFVFTLRFVGGFSLKLNKDDNSN